MVEIFYLTSYKVNNASEKWRVHPEIARADNFCDSITKDDTKKKKLDTINDKIKLTYVRRLLNLNY
ncbi:hypothetical protein V1478_009938 [Vespula squamosa]|uniref:Uncharacterized protein n=1 Tax=Vespula squamosa TaxID=30214 RepID=A0ABD2AKN1_VESSQ